MMNFLYKVNTISNQSKTFFYETCQVFDAQDIGAGQVKQSLSLEPVSKCSILSKVKKSENFNRRNTLSISRIALKLHFVQNLSLTQRLDKRGRFELAL